MVSELRDTALGMQAQVDEFVEQYAESTKRVIGRECSDVKKHVQDLVENAESLAWHEENVVSELCQELHQARLQVSHGSSLAEQHQRQLESGTVEPLLECLGTSRTKAVSDPFREKSLVCESSMPAAPEQAQGVCGFWQQSARNRGQSLTGHRPRNRVFGCPTVEAQVGLRRNSCAP